jgi:hypothetical protein
MGCPSLQTDYNITSTACNACAGSATWQFSVNPLHCDGKYGRKTVSVFWVKCPSLLTEFNLTNRICTGCVAPWVLLHVMFQWNRFIPRRQGPETISSSRVKWPLLLPDFERTCVSSGGCGGSATCIACVTTQQCGLWGWKTVSVSRVKCPMLLPDICETGTLCGASGEGATFDVWVTQLKWEAR